MTQMTSNVTNKRVRAAQIEQTKADIRQAMLEMMQDQPFAELKIGTVMTKAGYARRTFYRHFDSLEDVLTESVDILIVELYDFLKQQQSTSFSEAVYWFFSFWNQHRDFLRLLQKNQRLMLVIQSMTQHLSESPLVQTDLQGMTYAQHFAIGGMGQMLITWLERGCVEEPAQMVSVAQKIVRHLQPNS